MNTNISRETAAELLLKYNKNSFHIQHAVTVEAVMKYFAKKLGFEDDAEEPVFCMMWTLNSTRTSIA